MTRYWAIYLHEAVDMQSQIVCSICDFLDTTVAVAFLTHYYRELVKMIWSQTNGMAWKDRQVDTPLSASAPKVE
jgi:hypothetical protein